MKLTFVGAAHEVTGSCHYLEACGKHILLDCGMEQGVDVYENVDIPIEVTGLRPGEKLYEELLMKSEGLEKTEHDKIFIGELN